MFKKKKYVTKLASIFPDLKSLQWEQLEALEGLYAQWNAKINVISRKDMEYFFVHHVMHSLGIAAAQQFLPQARVLDVGTGGGFPGIPLAILFPETEFFLLDSIGKKIKVVEVVTAALKLKNVTPLCMRAEAFDASVDFVVSRAVTKMDRFVPWVRKNIAKQHQHERKNGILYLKGGDLKEELALFPQAKEISLQPFFEDAFFETKKVVYLPIEI